MKRWMRRRQEPPPDAEHVTQRENAQHRADQPEAKRITVEHVLLDIARIAFERLGIACLLEVVKHIPELNRPEPVQMRTVRIAFDLGKRMMLAMHRDPLLRAETGRNPQTEPEHEGDDRMQLESFVRDAAMKEDGCTEDGGLRNERGDAAGTRTAAGARDSLTHQPLRRSNSLMNSTSASTPSSGNAL